MFGEKNRMSAPSGVNGHRRSLLLSASNSDILILRIPVKVKNILARILMYPAALAVVIRTISDECPYGHRIKFRRQTKTATMATVRERPWRLWRIDHKYLKYSGSKNQLNHCWME
jgi:hypothetical protein